MKKKEMLAACMILSMTLGACGRTADAIPMETEGAQEEQPGSMEEDIVVAEEEEQEQPEEEAGITESGTDQESRVLIAYFSQPTDVDTSDLDAVSSASVVVRDDAAAGSTTEYVAKLIQETVGGDLFRIETVDEYPSDYDELVALAREEKENGARPECSCTVKKQATENKR